MRERKIQLHIVIVRAATKIKNKKKIEGGEASAMAASNGSEYYELQIDRANDFARPSNAESVAEDEDELMWAAISRLPSQKRSNYALLKRTASEQGDTETIDVRKLDRQIRELLVKKALATSEQDNYNLLSAIKERFDRYVSITFPSLSDNLIFVRFLLGARMHGS